MRETRRAIGCMSGTSMDAVDAVLIECTGRGLEIRVRIVDAFSVTLGDLGQRLRQIASGERVSASELSRLSLEIGERHARAVGALLAQSSGAPPQLCAAHGQTLFHEPPLTWQLLNPWPIARVFSGEIVCDLRGADAAAGGEGAPITPIADWVMYRDPAHDRVIVNLGGFCNATHLPAGAGVGSIAGFDVCACNHVLDGVARRALEARFDRGGAAARRGTVDRGLADELVTILDAQSSAGRSLGSGDEAAGWIDSACARLAPEDAAATAASAVGSAIAAALSARAQNAEVILAGGGVRNAALVEAIAAATGAARTTDELGVAAEHREGAAMGVLGLLARDGVRVTLPAVTGRDETIGREGLWIQA
ncbi:MAG: anhydro-N-acetylmuramic acid kinase [Planctomycetota bacterium]